MNAALRWWAPVWPAALADLRERSRGRGFVLALLLCGALAGLVLRGDVMLAVGGYRGAHNAAWVGAQMALVFNTLMTLFGYFLIKGGVQRDARSGLDEILGSTGLGALRYMLGKWLSHLLLLLAMLLVMLAMAVLQQFLPPAGLAQVPMGGPWRAAAALLGPFLVLSLPLLMLLAALSLVFESLPWMRGALGNGLVVLLLGVLMSQAVLRSERGAAEPLGISVLVPDMRAALLSQLPQEKMLGFTLGSGFTSASQLRQQGVFQWQGVDWSARQLLTQWAFVLPAAGLLGLAAFLHTRQLGHGRRVAVLAPRKRRMVVAAEIVEVAPHAVRRLQPVQCLHRGLPRFMQLLWAELRLLLRQPRWWQAGALALMVAGALQPSPRIQHDLLLASLAWAALMLAPAGGRAPAHDAGALLGSSACGGRSQRLALFAAGVLLCLGLCGGAGLALLAAGRWELLLATAAACLFLPALLISLGAWSGGPHLGESVAMLWLLLGWQGLTPLDPLLSGAPAYAGLALLAWLALELMPRRRLEQGWT